MSARQECKDVGLFGLSELSSLTGKTRKTLYQWYVKQHDLFLCALIGAVIKKNLKGDNSVEIGKKLKVFTMMLELKG